MKLAHIEWDVIIPSTLITIESMNVIHTDVNIENYYHRDGE